MDNHIKIKIKLYQQNLIENNIFQKRRFIYNSKTKSLIYFLI
ncbi:hypothetical protein HMPREF1863_00070 [Aedoeadaptatus coxii]|uniref:Uncharacterized protein n=1 Tax=Aedoeadaptatus coxii TaxID=755172 RepID=A0A134AL29_9FIRM|nr:hypothetical protein HMPREF1863_00070 [Peptoniphilus coxii]